MEEKKSKGKKKLPAAESFTNPDAVGWLFKLIHEGWLRKRWRKRYCVLSNGIVYLYEQQSSDGSEKTCHTVNLKLFQECAKASEKESKKSPNTFFLEPMKKDEEAIKNSTDTNKKAKPALRETFYAETSEEMNKWILKLQESLSLANIGGNSKLKHITKTRARPPRGNGGNRRPPTKQHIKERALMSEVSLDVKSTDQLGNGTSPKKRGSVPLKALRPPPGTKTSLKSSNSNEPEENGNIERQNSSSTSSLSSLRTPTTPKPPPAALKPLSTKRIVAERSDSTSSVDSKPSLSSNSPVIEESAEICLEGDEKNESVLEEEGVLTEDPAKHEGDPQNEELEEHEITIKENDSLQDESSLSLQTSSNDKNPDSSEKDSLPSAPPSPPLSDRADEEQTKTEIEEEDSNHAEEKKVEDDESETKSSNIGATSSERIEKAKSMETLNLENDALPPPPLPPPSESINGEECDNNNQSDLKAKEEIEETQRPTSLVLDA